MKVRFTKQARKEFFRIVDVFAEYAGQNYADKFINKVVSIGNQLCKYPSIGHPEYLLKGRKRLYQAKAVNENYRIIYYVARTYIWIVDIWDRRRNPTSLTKRLK